MLSLKEVFKCPPYISCHELQGFTIVSPFSLCLQYGKSLSIVRHVNDVPQAVKSYLDT